MGQPATTNPMLIMLINMTIVFAVLFGLSLIIRVTRYLDPTQKKKLTADEPSVVSVAAPAPVAESDNGQLIAVIAAAMSAYGYSASQIAVIRPIGGQAWAQAARLEVVQTRNQMF